VLLAMNVHENTSNAERLARLCAQHHVDIVVLQEVQPENREPFLKAFDTYRFFWADQAEFEEDYGQTSSMTGILERRLPDRADVRVETGITGYRTFAISVSINGAPMRIVNVHTTKPVHLADGISGLVAEAVDKFAAHRDEWAKLETWLANRQDLPIILAGDFNAPRCSRNLDFSAITRAHDLVGNGLHLTFPTWLPLVGIDHTLGNRYIEFHTYSTLDTGFGDHKAQLVHFTRKGP